ncbi:MAG: pseudouridylate synthase [Candidatus Cryptobacteroides sp.]
MELREIDIREILPQREPILMVSRLLSYTDTTSVSELDIKEDNFFLDADGCLCAEGLTENIAQTCAARIGYYHKYILGEDVRIGFIGAVKGLVYHLLPSGGQTIVTEVSVLQEVFNVTLVSACVKDSEGNVLAEGTMKIALDSK